MNYGGVYDFGSLSASNALPSATLAALQGALPAGFPIQGLSAVQAYGFGVPGDLHSGRRQPHRLVHQQAFGIVLGRFLARAQRTHSELRGSATTWNSPPRSSNRPRDWLFPAFHQSLGLQKGIHTDTNNFQPRIGVAYDPLGDAAKLWGFALLMEFSMTTHCWVYISWATHPMDPPADNWHLPALVHARGQEIPATSTQYRYFRDS